MGELLVAIALLCQVTGNQTLTSAGYNGYDQTKDKQKTCQQKLVKCVYDGDQLTTPKKLASCIEKGDY